MKILLLFKLLALFLLLSITSACDSEDKTEDQIKIGILSGIDVFLPTIEGFQKELQQIGYVEGKNVTYETRSAGGDIPEMNKVAKEFADSDIDLLFTTTNSGALAAKRAFKGTDTPIVFTIVIAPVSSGIVDSLSKPSDNITGVRNPLDEFIGKRLEYLISLAPDVKNVWAPRDPDYPTIPVANKNLRSSAKLLGINLIETTVKNSTDISSFLERVTPSSFDAILILPDLVVQNRNSLNVIFSYSKKYRIPVVANALSQLSQGAIFSYAVDNQRAGVQAASLVDKILKNRKKIPMSIINSEPLLYINSKVVKNLKLKINVELEALASEIW